MRSLGFLADIKSFLIQAAAGILSSAVVALITIPDKNLELGSLALGVVSIPIFFALGELAISIYGILIIIKIVDVVATKLHLFDAFDDFS